MKDIFITTTNSIENASIDKYLGIVSINKVIGTNFFSDFDASITDIFGGNSGTYQRKLNLIYKQSIESLSEKARMCGANGIIGLHIDFDEISGKGKSMFMVSAVGTAIVMSVIKDKKTSISNKFLSYEDLNEDVQKRRIIKKVNDGYLPDSEEWSFLKSNFIPEVAKKLLIPYIKKNYSEKFFTESGKPLMESNFPYFFKQMDKEEAENILYQYMLSGSYFYVAYNLAKLASVFSSKAIIESIKSQKFEKATKFLEINKETYAPEDVETFSEIISLFDELPDVGHYEVVKGIFSKPEEKYICSNGHKNPKDTIFCQDVECRENIKGLTFQQVQRIDLFRLKLESIKDFFNKATA